MSFVNIRSNPAGPITNFSTAVVATYINSVVNETDQTTYNFGNFTAPTAGLMVVLFGARGGTVRAVSSVSIGGTNGTLALGSLTGANKYAIAYRQVSSGANAVTVTLAGANGTSPSAGVAVWLITGNTYVNPYWLDAQDLGGTPTGGDTATYDLMPHSVHLFMQYCQTPKTVTWSNATQDDSTQGASLGDVNTAHRNNSTAVAVMNQIESTTWTTGTNSVLMGAGWV